MTDQIVCHCVSSDCLKCPMRNTGTSGIRAEKGNFNKQQGEKQMETKDE